MTVIGHLSFASSGAIRASRNKVLQLARLLTGDDILSVRMAAVVSTCMREAAPGSEGLDVEVGLRTLGSGDTLLALRWSIRPDSHVAHRLATCFDLEPDGKCALLASRRLTITHEEVDSLIPTVREIIERKDREELMSDLHQRNAELQESLENLRRTRSAKERMESELNIGREIQMSMLPLDFPIYPDRKEFEAFAVLEPAREVGGDFYDLFLIDNRHFCYSVGDVSGKGVPSALFMAVTKTLIKSRAANDLSPASILSHVNSELSQNNESCMFVTIFLAILDVQTGETVYSNAGHNPPYIRRADGSLERLSARHGPIVGAAEGIAYSQDSTTLTRGDLMLLYTDGVTEAADSDYNLYSEDRLSSLFNTLEGPDVEPAIASVLTSVQEFRGEAEPSDDITILGVRYHGLQPDSSAQSLDISVPNRLDEIVTVTSAFEEYCDRSEVPSTIRRKVSLVFDELLNNIVSYAYDDEEEHLIEIRLSLNDHRLTITIVDDGRPFNPFEVAEPDTSLSIEDRDIGGLGVHLVKNLMDEAHYERRGERNVVTLIKSLD